MSEFRYETVPYWFRRTKARVDEDLMREDQVVLGELGEDALIILHRLREEARREMSDILLFGATHRDADGNRIPPEQVSVSAPEPGALDHFFTGPDAA